MTSMRNNSKQVKSSTCSGDLCEDSRCDVQVENLVNVHKSIPLARPDAFFRLFADYRGPRALGFTVALYTWASRGGDLGVHPRCSDSPPRSRRKGRSRVPCIYLAYGRSTCAELASRVDTKASHDDTVEWEESRWVVPSSAPGCCRNTRRSGSGGWYPVLEHLPRARAGMPADDAAVRFGSTHANLRARESLRRPRNSTMNPFQPVTLHFWPRHGVVTGHRHNSSCARWLPGRRHTGYRHPSLERWPPRRRERHSRRLFFGSSRITGAGRSAFRPGILSHLTPRPWFAIALYTWASRGGDLGAHPRCSNSPPRSKRKAAHAAHVSIWPTAAPLVRNSPRGWTPRSLTTIRLSERRAAAWRLPEHQGDAEAVAGTQLPITSVAPVPACRPTILPRALARPTRTSGLGRAFGAHPRGEFRTSGAAVGQ
jgi:hypothetical protein